MRFGQSVMARTSGEFLTLTADTSKFRCSATARHGHTKLPTFSSAALSRPLDGRQRFRQSQLQMIVICEMDFLHDGREI